MKNLKLLALIFTGALLSFDNTNLKVDRDTLAGTYGICACQGADESSVIVRLSLFQDGSYQYIDNSQKQKVNHKGTWDIKKGKIILQASNGFTDFHRVWKTDAGSPCLKARKGLCFYRLCNVKACNK